MLFDYDPDYMCSQDILYRYRNLLGFASIEKIFVLEPGKELTDGLFLVHDDSSVRRVLDYIRRFSWIKEIEFYANHEVNDPIFQTNILPVEWHNE